MSRIILDAAMIERLQGLQQPLELCDESGRTLARVLPVYDPAEYDLEPQISEEELRRRMSSNEPRYTTEQVLAHLRSL